MKKKTNSDENGITKLAVGEPTPPEEKDVTAPAETVARPDEKPDDKPAVKPDEKKEDNPDDKPAAVAPDAPTPEPSKPEADQKPQLSREEFAEIANKFGDVIASKVMRDGGDYSTAMAVAYDATKAENETLRAKLAEATGQPSNGKPVTMTKVAEKATLFKTGK